MDANQLLTMSQEQLDDLFKKSDSGPIPDGEAKGTAIIAPGTVFSREIAEFVNIFAWHGKTFDGKRGVLTNRITPFGLNAIVAEVYKDKSWLDGKECIVLDYSKTSWWRTGYGMRSGSSKRNSILAKCIGIRSD